MTRTLLLAATAALLAGCSTTAPRPTVSAEGQERLQRLLAGKVPGPPMACIPRHAADDMTIISDGTVLFKDGSNRVYRNDFRGGTCNGLASGFYAMKTRSFGSGPCRGDIVEIVDTRTGMMVGTCAFGDFVPFTRPPA